MSTNMLQIQPITLVSDTESIQPQQQPKKRKRWEEKTPLLTTTNNKDDATRIPPHSMADSTPLTVPSFKDTTPMISTLDQEGSSTTAANTVMKRSRWDSTPIVGPSKATTSSSSSVTTQGVVEQQQKQEEEEETVFIMRAEEQQQQLDREMQATSLLGISLALPSQQLQQQQTLIETTDESPFIKQEDLHFFGKLLVKDSAKRENNDIYSSDRRTSYNDNGRTNITTSNGIQVYSKSRVVKVVGIAMTTLKALLFLVFVYLLSTALETRRHQQTIKLTTSEYTNTEEIITTVTLRDFLIHPDGFHLAMAPAFFGFYAYLGALIAMEDDLVGILPTCTNNNHNAHISSATTTSNHTSSIRMKSVVGSSAGAMVAILIAAGISPRLAATFVTSLTLQDFADPPGLFAMFRGIKFEHLMKEFLKNHTTDPDPVLERAILPVAVTTFDLTTWEEKIFTHGCMAQAARASATFPGLFQPVFNEKSILIDGGITDWLGLNGLRYTTAFSKEKHRHHRIVNIQIGTSSNGSLLNRLLQTHTSQFLQDQQQQQSVSLLSIIITNTPPCGPWAMSNGIRAVEATRRAFASAWDYPLILTTSNKNDDLKRHYQLYLNASLVDSIGNEL